MTENDTRSAEDGTARTSPPLWIWVAAGTFGVAVALGSGTWLARTSLAESAIASWCEARGITCTVEVERLGLSNVEAQGIRIESDGQSPITISDLSATLHWAGWLRPEVDTIVIDGAVLRSRFDGETLSLYGLEDISLGDGSARPPSRQPDLTVTNSRIEIATDAGPVGLSISASGRIGEAFAADITLDPVDLSDAGDRILAPEGRFNLNLDAGSVSGSGALVIERVELDGLTVDDLTLAFTAEPTGDGQYTLTAEGRSGPSRYQTQAFERLTLDLTATVAPDPEAASPELSAIRTLSAQGTLGEMRSDFGSALDVLYDLDWTGTRDGALGGATLLSLTGLASDQISAETLSLDGTLTLQTSGLAIDAADWTGGVVIKGGALGAGIRAGLRDLIALPEPLTAHATDLRDRISNGLSRFDTGLDIAARWSPETFSLAARRPTQLTSASGLTFSATPATGEPWLTVNPETVTVNGDVSLRDTAGFNLAASLVPFELPLGTTVRLNASAAPLVLAPWTAGGLTIGVDADTLSYTAEGETARANARGEIALDGKAFDMTLAEARLFGGVDARRGSEGWRVQMAGTDCLALTLRALTSGTLKLRPAAISFCPEDGRLLRRGTDGKLVGSATLGDVTFGFESPGLAGDAKFSTARADWTLDRFFTLELSAANADIPLTLPSGTLRLQSDAPDVKIGLSGQSPTLATAFASTRIDGSILPAKLNVRSLTFDGAVERSGISGAGRFDDVVIRDLNEDPLYQPLNLTGALTLRRGRLSANGDLKLNGRTEILSQAALDLDLAKLDGSMTLAGAPITFRQGGLQPSAISDQVRGLFTNATGQVIPRADLFISGGNLSGTGEIVFDGLSWTTLRFGSVRGVSGRVVFDDIVNLRTLPSQSVRIAEIDPGIPLRDGEITFQLLSASEAKLESARWPFAGGELAILPTSWTVQAPSSTVTAELREIRLGEFVRLLKVPDLDVTGTASGSFPVTIEGSNVLIKDALLTVDQSGGVVRYTGATGAQAGSANEQAKLTFDALRNFNFSVLALRVNGNIAGTLTVGVELLGRNPDVLDGVPFQMNINLEGPLIPLLSRTGRLLSGDTAGEMVLDMIRSGETESDTGPDTKDNSE